MKDLIKQYVVKEKVLIRSNLYKQKKKKNFHNKNKGKKSRAMGNEILSQPIMLKGTYFICNLYFYFLIQKKTSEQHIMLKGTYFLVISI